MKNKERKEKSKNIATTFVIIMLLGIGFLNFTQIPVSAETVPKPSAAYIVEEPGR